MSRREAKKTKQKYILSQDYKRVLLPSWGSSLLVTIPAVNRSVGVGFEGHFGLFSAVSARYLVHLSWPKTSFLVHFIYFFI